MWTCNSASNILLGAKQARSRLEKRLLDKHTVDTLASTYPRLAEQLYAARLRLLIRQQLLSICHSADGVHGQSSAHSAPAPDSQPS